MTRREAGKLLGGHAPGILTEAERRALYAAALEDQALFDALADEEALRELLADPAARSQLLAALRPARRPLPLWRRPAALGVAASLLVAGLASLAVLHGPERRGLPALPEAPAPRPPQPAPAARQEPTPREAAAPVRPPKAGAAPVQAPAPRAAGAAREPQAVMVLVPAPSAPVAAEAADAARVTQVRAEETLKAASGDMARGAAPAPAGVAAGRVEAFSVAPAPTPPRPAAKRERQEPVWHAVAGPEGTLDVDVAAAEGSVVLLLRRAPAVTVFRLQTAGPGQWRGRIPVAPGQVVDLYVLAHPVPDPAGLPETGPLDGFRVRVHPPAPLR